MQNELSKQIISSFAEIAKDKGIDRDLLLSILEDVFRTMIRKKYETDDVGELEIDDDGNKFVAGKPLARAGTESMDQTVLDLMSQWASELAQAVRAELVPTH